MHHALQGHPRQMGYSGEFWQNMVHWKREWQTILVVLPWEPHEHKQDALTTWCEQTTHWRRPWCWKDWRQKEKRATEDEMVGWHHRLNGPESEWIPGDGGRQGSLVRCSPRGHKESDMAHGLNNNKTSVRLEVSVLCWALTVFNEKRSRDRWVSS